MTLLTAHSDAGSIAERLDAVIDQAAGDRDDRLLARLRMRLQAVRFTGEEIEDAGLLAAEAARVLARIRLEQEPHRHWHRFSMPPDLSETRFEVRMVDPAVADVLHRSFHYIGTPRSGLSFGLFDRESEHPPPATLLTFSRFDLDHLRSLLPAETTVDQVAVLSRVYSFRWAPRNAFSYTFRRALAGLGEVVGETRLVLTYVNPNMGFTGASYKASNWLDFAREREVEYHYLDGVYTTRRELVRHFETSDLQQLRALLGPRLTVSRRPLAPLEVLVYPAAPALRRVVEERAGAIGVESAPVP